MTAPDDSSYTVAPVTRAYDVARREALVNDLLQSARESRGATVSFDGA